MSKVSDLIMKRKCYLMCAWVADLHCVLQPGKCKSPISSGALPLIAVETLLPYPPPLKPIGPIKVMESSSNTSLSGSSDSFYSCVDDTVSPEKLNSGIISFCLTRHTFAASIFYLYYYEVVYDHMWVRPRNICYTKCCDTWSKPQILYLQLSTQWYYKVML